MNIQYHTNRPIGVEEFTDLLERSTLAERRPVAEPERIAAMLRHANLLCTAWDGDLLVGVARSLTDFSFCCYLSDLAVDANYQKRGIGARLVEETKSRLHPGCKVILLAAPKAREYYPRIGFTRHESAWVIDASEALSK